MELEFDKEIDAILRKTGNGGRGVNLTAPHFDADTVAAFAEDALPQKTKMQYTEHFADCDRCRALLSQTISFNTEPVVFADSPVLALPVEPAASWYIGFFKTPNLAAAMGALIIVFGGTLGFLIFQYRSNEANSSVSQVTESMPAKGGPYFNEDAVNSAANSTSVPVESQSLLTANKTADTLPISGASNANVSAPNLGRNEFTATARPVADDCKDCEPTANSGEVAAGLRKKSEPKPVAISEADSVSKGQKAKNVTKDGVEKDSKEVLLAGRSVDTLESRRDLPAPAAKSGPTRSGPVQMQSNQVNNNVFDMSVTRQAGGKTFVNRDGAWYDSAYKNQPTNNYRRGTDVYKKLDSGLRKIADAIGGTVILVWKEKAYRIQ